MLVFEMKMRGPQGGQRWVLYQAGCWCLVSCSCLPYLLLGRGGAVYCSAGSGVIGGASAHALLGPPRR